MHESIIWVYIRKRVLEVINIRHKILLSIDYYTVLNEFTKYLLFINTKYNKNLCETTSYVGTILFCTYITLVVSQRFSLKTHRDFPTYVDMEEFVTIRIRSPERKSGRSAIPGKEFGHFAHFKSYFWVLGHVPTDQASLLRSKFSFLWQMTYYEPFYAG